MDTINFTPLNLSEMQKKSPMKLIIGIVVGVLILIAIVAVVFLKLIKPNYQGKNTLYKVSPTPIVSKTVLSTTNKWDNYNYQSDNGTNVAFSIQIPNVGENCDSCFVSLGDLPDGISINQILGTNAANNSVKDWSLVIGSFESGTQLATQEAGILSGNYIDTLKGLKVGDSKDMVSDGKSYTFIRLDDKPISTFSAQVYQTATTSDINFTQKNIALIRKDNTDILITFEYGAAKYIDAFNKILASLSFQKTQ